MRTRLIFAALLLAAGPILAQTQVVTTPVGGGGSGGTGTVTSVALAAPADLTVTGSPVTTSGTLTLTRASQAQSLFMASPSGSAGTPFYRAIVALDLPPIAESGVTNLTTDLGLKANLASPTFTGTVGGITATMVGLGNVNNTSDAAKPISTATQTALNLLAPLASPPLTGTPTAPTAAPATNTTQIATTAYVDALGALKLNLAGGTLTGQLVAAATGIKFNGTTLLAQGANILALTNGANAQTQRIFNTNDVDGAPVNAEWLSIDWTTAANTATISTVKAGTGTLRSLTLNALQTNIQLSGITKWQFAASPFQLQPGADNALDFGSAGLRVRDAYIARNIVQSVGTQITAAATITPTTPIVHVTGATPIATITVPAGMATAGNGGEIIIIPDSAFTWTTGGNIAIAGTAVISKPIHFVWDNTAAKWFPI